MASISATKHVPAQPISRGVSIREFAEINGVSQSAVRRGVDAGSIPSYKIGGARRIPLSYLEQLQRPGDAIEAAIEQIVAAAPPLSADQRTRIAALLRTGGAA